MSRSTWVLRDGQLVEKHLAAPLHTPPGSLYVISDNMDAVRSMADGKMYDSKSRYRADLRARGYIEVGNDSQPQRRVELPPVREALRQAYQQHRR